MPRLATLICLGINYIAYAQSLHVQDLTLMTGTEDLTYIYLQNDSSKPAIGLSCDVRVPAAGVQLSLEPISSTVGFQLRTREVENGLHRIVLYSEDKSQLPNGQIIGLRLQADDTVTEGTYTLGLERVTLADSRPSALSVQSSSGRLVLTRTCVSPAVTLQPVSQSDCMGQKVLLQAEASGAGLSYQWYLQGATIPNATSSILSVDLSQTTIGSYHCVISNGCGDVTSQSAELAISTGATIIQNPQNVEACVGETFEFSVHSSNGTSFQWRRDGQPLSGETSSTLSRTISHLDDFAYYDCLVSNSCGSAVSSVAELIPCEQACSRIQVGHAVEVEGELRVPVNLIQVNSDILSYELLVSYSANEATYLGYETAGTLSQFVAANEATAGRIHLTNSWTAPVQSEGVLIYLRFQKEEGPCTPVQIESAMLNEGFPFACTTDGELCNDCLLGDVTGAGGVSAYDASQILQHLVAGAADELAMCAADVTCNGQITAYDAAMILRYVVGLETVLPCSSGNTRGDVNYATQITISDLEVPIEIRDFTLPIHVSTDHPELYSFQFDVTFDPTIIQINDFQGLEGWNIESELMGQGHMRIAGAGIEALPIESTEILLNGRALKEGQVQLLFENVLFNEDHRPSIERHPTIFIRPCIIPQDFWEALEIWNYGVSVLHLVELSNCGGM